MQQQGKEPSCSPSPLGCTDMCAFAYVRVGYMVLSIAKEASHLSSPFADVVDGQKQIAGDYTAILIVLFADLQGLGYAMSVQCCVFYGRATSVATLKSCLYGRGVAFAYTCTHLLLRPFLLAAGN